MHGALSHRLEIGAVLLGRYEVVRELGRGGAATTYLVHDRRWGTNVALKLLRHESRETVETLELEFSRLRELFHPHLCQVHEIEELTPGGPSFYTADYIPGSTLGQFAAGADWNIVRRPLGDALEALRLLHAVKLVHGDFKPDNVLVEADGAGTLIDLGCARPILAKADGLLFGTPEYLAPEALRGDPPNVRTDLYAVGATLRSLGQVLAGPPPESVRALALRLTARDPGDRPTSVGEILEALWPERSLTVPIPPGLGRIVGRTSELEVARLALEQLEGGQPGPRVLCWVGIQGIGKSRLVRELRWVARGRVRTLQGNPESPRAICDLLERAVGNHLGQSGIEVGATGRIELAKRSAGCVLIVDDADRLVESERAVLRALARSVEPSDPVLLIVTSSADLELDGSALRRMALGPLTVEDLEALLGDAYLPLTARKLHAVTQGHPAAVRTVLLDLASARINESEICSGHAGPEVLLHGAQQMLSGLDLEQKYAVGILAALDRPIGKDVLEASFVPAHHLAAALEIGIVVREAAGYRLANPLAGPSVLAELGPEQAHALHRAVADWLLGSDGSASPAAGLPPGDLARGVRHLVRSGDGARARELLLLHSDLHSAAPQAWLEAGRSIIEACPDDAVDLAMARLEQMAGHAPSALVRLQSLLRRAPEGDRPLLRLEIGACHLRLGDASSAAAELGIVVGDAGFSVHAVEHVRATDLLTQALCRLGRYDQALDISDRVASACTDPALRADLDEAAGVALAYLGRLEEARERLAKAARVEGRNLPPRYEVRSLGARALVEFQVGNLESARDLYAQSLHVAERHGLGDQLANSVLNLGTVQHQLSFWSEALGSYERALRLSIALGQTATQAHALFNLTKLYLDIGSCPRAESMLARCAALAGASELSPLESGCDALRAELALNQQDLEGARHLLERARTRALERGDARDQAEAEIQLGEVLLAMGDPREAAATFERLCTVTGPSLGLDVRLRVELGRARTLLVDERFQPALAAAEHALAMGRDLRSSDLEAEAELLLAELWRHQGSAFLAAQHRTAARSLWERSAALLPPELRESFWKHRRREPAFEQETPARDGAAPASRERQLEMLVDIFRRLNSSLKTRDVLERAMDAAIELTQAERGFLLLCGTVQSPSSLEVAVARNLDREQLEKSHLKFSRTIAEQVIASGEPLVTASAQADPRFSAQESVHAMRLQSVVCVPVNSPSGRLGALYLDNRFRSHRSSDQEIDLLMAFADQVAIALVNARLHTELEQRNRELLQETHRVEQLLSEREAEVERLAERVAFQTGSNPRRFDYGTIVGSSAAMQQVLDVLDRVIDTELTVLIEGESGTGKELIARAVHANSERTGPMVAINCAAVPEPLLEAELFGYCRGAFTGAERARDGLFVQARGGTLLLDELGEMPLSMQVKLLRVLQEREVRPLGASSPVVVDVRLVCATNRRLRDEVARGTFREDLYYRVSSVEVVVPPLRERPEDLPELIAHLVRHAAERMQRPPPEVTRQALRKLCGYTWPGNVRQLENVLTRAVVLGDGRRLAAPDIQLPETPSSAPRPLDRKSYAEHEARTITQTLEAHRWNVAKAARLLEVSRPTLYRRIRAYGLRPPATSQEAPASPNRKRSPGGSR